jgi:hypothetical protein
MRKTNPFAVAVLIAVVALVASGLVLPGAASAEVLSSGFLSLNSEPGDYVGQGQQLTFSTDNASFEGFNNFGGPDTPCVYFRVFSTGGSFWILSFAGADGAPLIPGVYEGATRWGCGLQGPGEPGLEVVGEGRGCNTLTGRFEIQEARFGPSGEILAFAATFEQHCEGADPALFGEIRVANPPTPLECGATINDQGLINRQTGQVTLRGTAPCNHVNDVEVSGTVTQLSGPGAVHASFFIGTSSALEWVVTFIADQHRRFIPTQPVLVHSRVTAIDAYYGTVVTAEAGAVVTLMPCSSGLCF